LGVTHTKAVKEHFGGTRKARPPKMLSTKLSPSAISDFCKTDFSRVKNLFYVFLRSTGMSKKYTNISVQILDFFQKSSFLR